MPTQVAKKRFIPNTPVKAGVLYKYTVEVGNSQKTYTLQSKFNNTLSEMNPMWFINNTPKEWFFNRASFAAANFKLMPGDRLILTDEAKTIANTQVGFMEKSEMTVLLQDEVSTKLASPVLVSEDETARFKKINIYPFKNDNYEETKYHQIFDQTTTVNLHLREFTEEVYIFETMQVFTPVAPNSSVYHKVVVNFGAYTPSYQGTSPNITGSLSATYYIPNELTSRKMTFTASGSNVVIKMENYV